MLNIVQETLWKTVQPTFINWLDSLSPVQAEAIEMYMFHEHSPISKGNHYTAALQEALKTTYTGESVSYRGGRNLNNYIKGDIFVADRFLSSSVDPHIAVKFMRADSEALYRIKGLNGQAVDNSMGEQEILFNKGSQYEIVNVEPDTTVRVFYVGTEYSVTFEKVCFIDLQQIM